LIKKQGLPACLPSCLTVGRQAGPKELFLLAFQLRINQIKMKIEEIKKYIVSVKWQFAKTMPENPHEYTVVNWNPDNKEPFYDFVKYIRKYGKNEIFYSKKYTYLEIDNYKYWTMGEPVKETTLINRKVIEKLAK
jgi:hypothetical protein